MAMLRDSGIWLASSKQLLNSRVQLTQLLLVVLTTTSVPSHLPWPKPVFFSSNKLSSNLWQYFLQKMWNCCCKRKCWNIFVSSGHLKIRNAWLVIVFTSVLVILVHQGKHEFKWEMLPWPSITFNLIQKFKTRMHVFYSKKKMLFNGFNLFQF